MEPSVIEHILDELLPSFEELETQSGAILQFLKDKGIATDEGLAPYVEQARSASAVRWRAARLRINRVLTPAFKMAEKTAEEERSESTTKAADRTSGATQEQPSGKEQREQEDIKQPKNTARTNKDAAPTVEKNSKKENITDHPEKGAA